MQVILDYIGLWEGPQRGTMLKLHECIKKQCPMAEGKMSYGIPTYFWHENVVHFAAYKKHIGFYPTPSAMQEFKVQFKGYKTSKGAVQFPLDDKLNLKLIKSVVAFRVKSIKEKFENKKFTK